MSTISVSQNTFTIDVNIEELKLEDYHERSIIPYLSAIEDPMKLSDTIKKFKIYKLEEKLDNIKSGDIVKGTVSGEEEEKKYLYYLEFNKILLINLYVQEDESSEIAYYLDFYNFKGVILKTDYFNDNNKGDVFKSVLEKIENEDKSITEKSIKCIYLENSIAMVVNSNIFYTGIACKYDIFNTFAYTNIINPNKDSEKIDFYNIDYTSSTTNTTPKSIYNELINEEFKVKGNLQYMGKGTFGDNDETYFYNGEYIILSNDLNNFKVTPSVFISRNIVKFYVDPYLINYFDISLEPVYFEYSIYRLIDEKLISGKEIGDIFQIGTAKFLILNYSQEKVLILINDKMELYDEDNKIIENNDVSKKVNFFRIDKDYNLYKYVSPTENKVNKVMELKINEEDKEILFPIYNNIDYTKPDVFSIVSENNIIENVKGQYNTITLGETDGIITNFTYGKENSEKMEVLRNVDDKIKKINITNSVGTKVASWEVNDDGFFDFKFKITETGNIFSSFIFPFGSIKDIIDGSKFDLDGDGEVDVEYIDIDKDNQIDSNEFITVASIFDILSKTELSLKALEEADEEATNQLNKAARSEATTNYLSSIVATKNILSAAAETASSNKDQFTVELDIDEDSVEGIINTAIKNFSDKLFSELKEELKEKLNA